MSFAKFILQSRPNSFPRLGKRLQFILFPLILNLYFQTGHSHVSYHFSSSVIIWPLEGKVALSHIFFTKWTSFWLSTSLTYHDIRCAMNRQTIYHALCCLAFSQMSVLWYRINNYIYIFFKYWLKPLVLSTSHTATNSYNLCTIPCWISLNELESITSVSQPVSDINQSNLMHCSM